MIYYTYIHRKPGVSGAAGVFYIGKGSGNRMFDQGARRSQHWHRVVLKHGVERQICARWSTEAEAYSHETFLIEAFVSLGAPLVNKTSGGDGVRLSAEGYAARSTRIRETLARPEIKEKIRNSLLAAQTPEVRKKRGESIRKHLSDPGAREKIQMRLQNLRADPDIERRRLTSLKSSARDPNYRQKKREISLRLGCEPPHLTGGEHPGARSVRCVELGLVFETAVAAEQWLRVERGVLAKAARTAICGVCNGRNKSAYGFTWEYVE